MKLAFKALDEYGRDPSGKAECWWEYADKRSQAHWRCQVGSARYTVHISAVGNPINYVTEGWNFSAPVATSPYKLVAKQPSSPTRPPSVVASDGATRQFCTGPYRIPDIAIPAVEIPAMTIGDVHYPARTLPGRTLPGRDIPRRCVEIDRALLALTTVRVRNYEAVDPLFDESQTDTYWQTAGPSVAVPDVTASGFGELNEAGFPKNQYVRPYLRRDGTFVPGYWRNSPSDGLPTCRVIDC